MRVMMYAYITLALYGLTIGNIALSLLTLGLAFVLHKFDKRLGDYHKAQTEDPRYAKSIPDTLQKLDEQCCECMACISDPRFPNEK